MNYREVSPPPHLAGLIKARWTLAGNANADEWIDHHATPDGCVEVIWRLKGRSAWNGPQPARFVVGLITKPQPFKISGDAEFTAIRLWPWAWHCFGVTCLHALGDRWAAWDGPSEQAIEALLGREEKLNAIGAAIVGASSIAEMSAATGMAPRRLQRWFDRHVGLSPRAYLRLLRFQSAFETLPGHDSLADQAASHGFADQAHMSREMRRLAGLTPRAARKRATGPFLT